MRLFSGNQANKIVRRANRMGADSYKSVAETFTFTS